MKITNGVLTEVQNDDLELLEKYPEAFWGGVTAIGDNAFENCSRLKSITIPDSVTWIGSYAFRNCSRLTSITISDSVTWIGSRAFYGCSRLKSITIPDSVTEVGKEAFYGSGLESIEVDKDNPKYKSEGNCVLSKDGKTLIHGCKNSVIPDSVTEIGSHAFSGCDCLTSITIPDSVTWIGDSAFWDCSRLKSITISDSVTEIGWRAFSACNSLTSITIPESVTKIGDLAFDECLPYDEKPKKRNLEMTIEYEKGKFAKVKYKHFYAAAGVREVRVLDKDALDKMRSTVKEKVARGELKQVKDPQKTMRGRITEVFVRAAVSLKKGKNKTKKTDGNER